MTISAKHCGSSFLWSLRDQISSHPLGYKRYRRTLLMVHGTYKIWSHFKLIKQLSCYSFRSWSASGWPQRGSRGFLSSWRLFMPQPRQPFSTFLSRSLKVWSHPILLSWIGSLATGAFINDVTLLGEASTAVFHNLFMPHGIIVHWY